MRVHNLMMDEFPVFIEANNLASVSESRVDGHCPLLAYRRCKKQLLEVFTEDHDGILIRLLLGLLEDFSSDGRLEKTLVGIIHSHPYLFSKFACRITSLLTKVIVKLIAALFSISIDLH